MKGLQSPWLKICESPKRRPAKSDQTAEERSSELAAVVSFTDTNAVPQLAAVSWSRDHLCTPPATSRSCRALWQDTREGERPRLSS